jgi:hypothetical protein
VPHVAVQDLVGTTELATLEWNCTPNRRHMSSLYLESCMLADAVVLMLLHGIVVVGAKGLRRPSGGIP